MAFFDEVKRGLTNTGKQVAKKTKEISDTVQLKAQIAAEKEKAEKLYAEVGKKVFADASEEDNEKYAEEFEAIRKSLEKKKIKEGFSPIPPKTFVAALEKEIQAWGMEKTKEPAKK